ncbi:MAG TPA: alpha/beta fold hydrolase [Alphaproteobacteria bacterium]|jgi:pimeloyl-ACP methyl ester carboxylesterase|nr:alpha/beta fold hydrolase [Alphaproteobacteria bacterium]
MNTVSLVNDTDPAAIVADFERRARRFETPCGDGSIVWRSWGSGPPLLLAHGGHGAWSHWIRNIDALAVDRAVWALDLPGLGESALAPREDHEAISDAIATGLRQLIGAELPLDIVGFSFGGVVSAHLAAFHPELVRRLIVVDTGGLDLPMGPIDVRGIRGLGEAARRAVLRANLLSLMLHDPASVDELALHLQAVNVARARIKAERLVLPDRLLHILPRVPVQLDAIWGEHDQPHPDPAAQAGVFRRFHPELEMRVIQGAGHWSMYENPNAFNRTVRDLLSQPLRRR